MNKPTPQTVAIVDGQSAMRLSPAQEQFNALIDAIGTRRAQLKEWEAASDEFHKKFTAQYVPLEQELLTLKRQVVYRLHAAWPDKALGKGERIALSALIADMAQALLQRADDAELALIYQQHAEEEETEELASVAEVHEDKTIQAEPALAEDDFTTGTPEEIMQRMEAMLERQERERMQAAHAREAQRASRKKPPKQRAAEARQQEQRIELSQSIRAVYRRLASALHPDRELDESERARKTALMQQVNQAYEKNDLSRLLELQLELEQIDQRSIHGVSEERLTHYNHILTEQLGDLDQEIAHMERHFRQTFGLGPAARVSPKGIGRDLNKVIAGMRQEMRDVGMVLGSFGDVEQVRAWLKQGGRRQ